MNKYIYFVFAVTLLTMGFLYGFTKSQDGIAFLLTFVMASLSLLISLYTALFGSIDMRLKMKKIARKLDAASFKFLIEVSKLDKLDDEKKQRIAKYHQLILEEDITDQQQKKYLKYLELIKKFDRNQANLHQTSKILQEARKLEHTVDIPTRSKMIQEFYCFEAKLIWQKNIYKINEGGDVSDGKHSTVLIYTDCFFSGGRGGNSTDTSKAREVVNSDTKFKSRNKIDLDDNYYLDENLSECMIIFPSEPYELIKYTDTYIQINYNNKKITLNYNKPKSLNELGISDVVIKKN